MLIALLTVAAVWRFYQIRNLVLPAWVDSVHHTLLVRILLEQKTIPDTWAPYLPETPFYYHFGFHLSAAAVARLFSLDGLELGRAVLLTGQLWQVVLLGGIYALAWSLWGRHEIAVIALLLACFVSQMPAYYTTWGRYTLLAGTALLAFAMAAAISKRTILLALSIVCCALTHYYALFLLILFLTTLVIVSSDHRRSTLLGGAVGLGVAAFWLVPAFGLSRQEIGLTIQRTSETITPAYLWYLLGPWRGHLLLAIAVLGAIKIVIDLIHGKGVNPRITWSFVFWSMLVAGLLLPIRIGPFRPDHAAVVLFIPVVMLAAKTLTLLPNRSLTWLSVGLLVLVGVWQTRDIINHETVIADQNDILALEWIADNTAADTVFLIDTTPWSGIWRGFDGGWWITPLTGRRTNPPPAVYGWGDKATSVEITNVARRTYLLPDLDGDSYCQELDQLMTATASTHYYTRSSKPGVCPSVTPIYRNNRVTIYQVGPMAGMNLNQQYHGTVHDSDTSSPFP